ncbi:MAG: sulfite exporter TauE/SafE family protein [Chloroflexota bacterium]|nr:sulfite exporter TauE/SafE family protein [Chloroflexota bacterium]
MTWIALVGLGLLVGAYGTLVGAGGGFALVPVLLLLYPHDSPTTLTSISLAVVFLNAVSGSLAYGRLHRLDYRAGIKFALATMPGAVLGALVVGYIPRGVFDVLFGMLLLGLAGFILVRSQPAPRHPVDEWARRPGYTLRSITDSDGLTHRYSFHTRLSLVLSAGVGFLSSLLGIGGGIIHVPLLIAALHFPPHIATATSQFVLGFMSLAGTVAHVVNGDFATGWRRTAALGVGVIVGAQVGAALSSHVKGTLILRLLAVGLLLVGLRLVLGAL